MRTLSIFQLISGDAIRALCRTLIHSLWQGLIAAVIAGFIIMCTKHSRSGLRYNLLSVLFAFFLTTAGITFYSAYRPLSPEVLGTNSFTSVSNEYNELSHLREDILVSETSSYSGRLITFLDENAFIIVLVWFIFFLGRCVHVIRGMHEVHRIRTYYTYNPSSDWKKKLDELKEKLGIIKKVILYESRLVKTPLTVGYLKAAILVPMGLLANLPADQAESILLHELAHIRRRDYIVNFLQRLAEAVFFFNPAILWISSLIREEREACCDDMVIANMPDKKSYLEALVSSQEYTLGISGYAVGLIGSSNLLFNRVKRLIYNENKKLDTMERIILILNITAISALGFIAMKDKEPGTLSGIATIILPQDSKAPEHRTYKKNVDTLPRKKQASGQQVYPKGDFRSVSFDQSNDPKDSVHTYEITDIHANRFKVIRKNNEMTALSINGQQIPADQLINYQSLFNKMETFIRDRNNEKKQLMATLDPGLENKKIAKSNSSQKKDDIEVGSKDVQSNKEKSNLTTKKLTTPKEKSDKDNDKFTQEISWQKDAQRVEAVLQDLVQEGIVPNTSSVDWFGINENKMMVNGKEIAQALHGRLKTKYGIEKDYGLFYGPSKMYGIGIHFDKKDLHLFTNK